MLWLAHGADPTPLTWDEALATLVLAGITFGMLAAFSCRAVLRFAPGAEAQRGLMAWSLAGTALVTCLLGAFVSSAYRQLTEPRPPETFHAHYRGKGGQVAMFGNYHIEVTRDPAGDFRVYVTDAYRRPIAAQFFGGSLRPETGRASVPLVASLDNTYCIGRLPREVKLVRLSLTLPEKVVEFRLDFQKREGPGLPPQFCGARKR